MGAPPNRVYNALAEGAEAVPVPPLGFCAVLTVAVCVPPRIVLSRGYRRACLVVLIDAFG